MASPTVKVSICKEDDNYPEWNMTFKIDYGFAKFTHYINDASLRSLKDWKKLARGESDGWDGPGWGGVGVKKGFFLFSGSSDAASEIEDDDDRCNSFFKVEVDVIKKPLSRTLRKAERKGYAFGRGVY